MDELKSLKMTHPAKRDAFQRTTALAVGIYKQRINKYSMHKEKNFHGARSDENFNFWLKSGSLRRLNHTNDISRENSNIPFNKKDYCLETENTTEQLRALSSFHKKKRPALTNRQPTLIVSPMSELSIEYEDGIPSIKVTDFSATPQDIEDRIAEQVNRISTKIFSQRTPAEKKWLEKRNNTDS